MIYPALCEPVKANASELFPQYQNIHNLHIHDKADYNFIISCTKYLKKNLLLKEEKATLFIREVYDEY